MDIGLVLSIIISITSFKQHYKLSEEQEFKELFEENRKKYGLILIGGTETFYYHIIGEEIIDYKLNADEQALFAKSADAVRNMNDVLKTL